MGIFMTRITKNATSFFDACSAITDKLDNSSHILGKRKTNLTWSSLFKDFAEEGINLTQSVFFSPFEDSVDIASTLSSPLLAPLGFAAMAIGLILLAPCMLVAAAVKPAEAKQYLIAAAGYIAMSSVFGALTVLSPVLALLAIAGRTLASLPQAGRALVSLCHSDQEEEAPSNSPG